MKVEDRIKQVIKDSIEPALRAQNVYMSVLDNLKQLEATRNAYISAVESVVESVTPVLDHLETAMSAVDKVSIQKSIEPMLKNLREAVQIIQENDKQEEAFRIRTQKLFEDIARSQAEQKRIRNLEQRVEAIEKAFREK